MLYVTMPSGCLARRTSSAECPSNAVGAVVYRSSAACRETRTVVIVLAWSWPPVIHSLSLTVESDQVGALRRRHPKLPQHRRDLAAVIRAVVDDVLEHLPELRAARLAVHEPV